MSRIPISTAARILAIWVLACLASHAADQPEWRVTLDVQMVAITPAKALKLVPALREPATFVNAFAELQRMIESDEADLVAWPVVIVPHLSLAHQLNLQDAAGGTVFPPDSVDYPTSESIIEARSLSDIIPPDVPTTIGAPVFLSQFRPGEITTLTAFEMRNTGVTLGAEAVVSKDGDSIELEVRPERTQLLEYQALRTAITPAGIEAIFPLPQFQIAKIHSRLTVRSGRRMLLGAFVEPMPQAKVLLFLIKASAVRTGGKSPLP